MKKERKQYRITPEMQSAVYSFWKEYKLHHNIDDSLMLILVDGKHTLQELLQLVKFKEKEQ